MRIAFLLALLVTTKAQAGELCVDYYAAQSPKFPCHTAMRAFKGVKRPCMAVLYKTFGESTHCIEKFAALKGKKTLKLIATNQSCERLKRCEPFDRGATLTQIEARLQATVAIANQFQGPDLKVLISPGLEHAWSKGKQKKVFQIARKYWSGPLVNNPVGYDAKIALSSLSPYVELHAPESKFRGAPCIYSNDGFDINLSGQRRIRGALSVSGLLAQIERYRKRCDYVEIWWNTQGATARFTKPSKRDFRLYHSDVVEVNKILRAYE